MYFKTGKNVELKKNMSARSQCNKQMTRINRHLQEKKKS